METRRGMTMGEEDWDDNEEEGLAKRKGLAIRRVMAIRRKREMTMRERKWLV